MDYLLGKKLDKMFGKRKILLDLLILLISAVADIVCVVVVVFHVFSHYVTELL